MKLARRSALLALALALASCEYGPTEPYAAELKRLDRSRALWERSRVRDYHYTVTNTCFCPEEFAGPVVVEVREGNTVSATYASTGAPARPQPFASMDSVDELFDTIARALDREPDAVNVSYDPELGYPVSAHFDFDTRTADEEGGFRVRGFQRL
jgi:hypothetical protein